MILMRCPRCLSADLVIVEQLTGCCRGCWDSSTTTGISCERCGWAYTGTAWYSQLLRDPSTSVLVAATVADIDAHRDGPDLPEWDDEAVVRITELIRTGSAGDLQTDARVMFFANVVPNVLGEDFNLADNLQDLHGTIVDLWPQMLATVT